MKRVQYDRYGGPGEMYLADFTLPPPDAGEVRVAIKAAAVNPLDWKLRRGAMKMLSGRRFPKAMGSDFAGVVEAVGTGVIDFSPGDAVFGTMDIGKSGAFAEAAIVAATNLVKKPPQLSFGEAACLPIPAMTAWVALVDRAQMRAGSRVFVNGCNGAVGAFAVQLAIACGAQVCGACGPASRDSAIAAGVNPVFSYSDGPAYAQGGPYDAAFDTLGTLAVGQGLAMLKPDGVFVDINPTFGRALRGMPTRRYKLAFANTGLKHLPGIARLAGEGALQPTIGREAPSRDALFAVADAESGARPGRTVILF